jgi:pyridoxamine 5'-phosphate oxidase
MKKTDIASLRREYMLSTLDEKKVDPNPISQFSEWFQQGADADLPEVNAMTLATVSPEGQPSARVVLLKDFDSRGFVFFTNYLSHKANELQENPRAALVFFWPELQRQVRVEGHVEKVSPQESDEYFASRPRDSQIGAIMSEQSQVVPDREYIDQLFECVQQRLENTTPSRPETWGGYRLIPNKLEFWQGRLNRLNDRILYSLEENQWEIYRLAP